MKHYRVNQSAAVVAVLAFSATLSVAGGAEASVGGMGAVRAADGPRVSGESLQSLLACLSEVAKQMQGVDAALAVGDASRTGWDETVLEQAGVADHAGWVVVEGRGALQLLNLPPPRA